LTAIALIAVPYEVSRLRDGVGRGPERLLAGGAAEALEAAGATVDTEVVELTDKFSNEIGACFELIRRVRGRVDAALRGGAFPVVLSGSCCFAALGAVAAMEESAPGVVWFDAHGDFNTPETTTFGYVDGMGLAVLTGDAWQAMHRTVPGAKPLPESAIVLAGARDFDDDEARRLRDSEIKHLPAERIASGDELDGAMAALEPEPTALYLHVDLDVLDPEQEAPANIYSAGRDHGGAACRASGTGAQDRFSPGRRPDGLRPPSATPRGACRPLPTGCSEPWQRALRETTGYLTRTRKRRALTASRAALRR
jgi:arginase